MPVYKDTQRNTWYTKFRYKNWQGEIKWAVKRGFSTKREATQWERDFMARNEGSTDMLFSDFVKNYLRDRTPRLKASTLETKENIIKTKILPYFEGKPLSTITTSDIMQWQNALLTYCDPCTNKPFSKSYLKTVHNQLTAIFNHAVRFYGLKENPARVVGNMGSENDIHMKFWTKEEYLRFSEAMMDVPIAYYCFEVLYWCGIREGELLALTRDDIDLETKTLSVTKTYHRSNGQDIVTSPKTPESNRVISMPSFLCDELSDYIKLCYDLAPSDRLFPVSKGFLQRQMQLGTQKQGLTKIRIHDLRHSHVSLLISMGFNAVDIAKRLGHKSIDITYRYAHLFPSVQTTMADKLDAIMGGNTNE